eukprot:gene22596-29736_t
MAYPGASGPYFSKTKDPMAPPPTPDSQFLGANSIFLSLIPFTLATALQVESIRTALIVGTSTAVLVLVVGLLLWLIKARHTPIFILDAAMLIIMSVQLGVSFPFREEIEEYYVFITCSALAGIIILSMLFSYPATLQHVRECVLRTGWRMYDVRVAAYITSGLLASALIISTLLYIIPVAEDTWQDKDDALTIVFQIVVPIVFYFLGLLITRLSPIWIARSLENSKGFDEAAFHTINVNPIASGMM